MSIVTHIINMSAGGAEIQHTVLSFMEIFPLARFHHWANSGVCIEKNSFSPKAAE